MRRVLAGRGNLPWGRRVLIKRNTVARMLLGQWPDAETLVPCCRIEAVSLNWLVAGIGQPFSHDIPATDRDAWRLLKSVQRDQVPCTVYSLEAKGAAPALLIQSIRTESLPEPYQWNQVIVLRPNLLTPMLIRDLRVQFETSKGVRVTIDSAETLQRILDNEVGNFELFGDDDEPALLDGEAVPYAGYVIDHVEGALRPGSSHRIAEPPQSELHQRIDRCTQAQQAAMLEIVRGLTRD